MKKRLLYLILPMITLMLELLPFGAVCNFANADGRVFRMTYSYFSLIPFGYANFAPLVTALLTCVIIILLTVYCIMGSNGVAIVAKSILWICAVISLGPLTFGIRSFSVVGALITVSLIAELILFEVIEKKQNV